MQNNKFIAGLDVVVRLLSDPNWSEKAKKIKTLEEMRQILFDFCEANGKVVQVDKDTFCLYV